MPRGGSGITFGKVSVFSNEEGLRKCEETLASILQKHGYPEVYDEQEEADDVHEREVEELKREIAADEENEQEDEEKKPPWLKE